jgi:hypothetical protein
LPILWKFADFVELSRNWAEADQREFILVVWHQELIDPLAVRLMRGPLEGYVTVFYLAL